MGRPRSDIGGRCACKTTKLSNGPVVHGGQPERTAAVLTELVFVLALLLLQNKLQAFLWFCLVFLLLGVSRWLGKLYWWSRQMSL